MPGHTPREAVENYRGPIHRAVKTLNPTAFLVPGRQSHNYQLGAEGYWRLGDEDGLRLTPTDGVSSMRFQAEQKYKIVECDPQKHDPELGCYRVTTLMYAYELTIEGVTLWHMHWHPIGDSDEFRPHYHISGDGRFSVKDHLPSGRHTIEDAVEWCITIVLPPLIRTGTQYAPKRRACMCCIDRGPTSQTSLTVERRTPSRPENEIAGHERD